MPVDSGPSVPSAAGGRRRTLRLGELLLQRGMIGSRELDRALAQQQALGGHLGTSLLEAGVITETKLLAMLGEQRSTPTVSAAELHSIPAAVLRLVPPRLVQRHLVLPFELRGRTLLLAAVEPAGVLLVEDEVRMFTSCLVRTFIGLEFRIREAIQIHYGGPQEARWSTLARRLSGQGPVGSAGSRAGSRSPRVVSATVTTVPVTVPDPVTRVRVVLDQPLAESPALPPMPSVEKPPLPLQVGFPDLTSTSAEHLEPFQGNPFAGLGLQPVDGREAPIAERPELLATDPWERLEEVACLLQQAEMRDDVGDAMLSYCAPYFRRRLVLAHRGGQLVGWRAEGEGVHAPAFESLALDDSATTVFSRLREDGVIHAGKLADPLPVALRAALHLRPPQECVIVPVRLAGRLACCLWGDNLENDVAQAPLAALQRLARRASLALEICVLRNRIRMV